MALHLVKLCVGIETISELEVEIERRTRPKRSGGERANARHRTRMVPKRVEELLGGGSLYWVIKGQISCRQQLLEVKPVVDSEGIPRCDLMLAPHIIPVAPRPMRPFQGWRYLAEETAPPDLGKGAGGAALPEALRRELGELGLL